MRLVDRVQPEPPYASGRYHAFETEGNIGNGSAAAAGTLRLAPYSVRRSVVAASLLVRVSTAAASGNFQLLVYDSDPATNDPTGAPIYQSASQSTASVASIEITGVNLTLNPGKVYWIGAQVDNATAAFTAQSTTNSFQTRLAGQTTMANAVSTSQITCMTKAGTFNSPPTLTGNRTTDSFTETNNAAPYVAFKAA